MDPRVVYTKNGEVQTFELDLPSLPRLIVDESNVPENQRGGLAKQLLGAAALACYAASLSGALEARGVHDAKIRGSSSVEFGRNAIGQSRITGMTLNFRVEIKETDQKIFEHCARLMKNGCLVTGSIEDGIEMKYNLDAVYK